MIIDFHKSFHKHAKKLPPAQKKRLKQALRDFSENPYHSGLKNHALSGKWKGHRSISLGGDWRAHYRINNKNAYIFVAVGTHSQLYN